MPFLLLFLLTLSSLQRQWPAPPEWYGLSGSLLLPWSVVAFFAGAAWLSSFRCRQYLQRDPTARGRLLARHAFFRRWHIYLLFAAYVTLLCLGGWGWFVAEATIHDEAVVPGADLLLLSPLIAALMLSWAAYYPLERELALCGSTNQAFPDRWSYVVLQARQHFLLIVPPLVLLFLQQLFVALWPQVTRMPIAMSLLGLGTLTAMYIAIPWLLRLLLGLKPLPPGPLRDRLMATAQRLSFRFSDILVWNTRDTVANAMVTGPLPVVRYVVLTDRLIDQLSAEEVEAVFGHEVGHVKHHHLLYYFSFLLASMTVVIGLWQVLEGWLAESPLAAWLAETPLAELDWLADFQMLSALPLLGVLGVYVVVVFGFLSRRCERQADIFGCRAVSVPVFVEALEKVARINGIHRDRPGWLMSWQHSTIALRVAFLQRMAADPALEPRFQRHVGLVKWGMLLSLAAVFVLLAVLSPGNIWAMLDF